MGLDDLADCIELLQQRLRDHETDLRENEIQTRMALIDPLLTALGWDVNDPRRLSENSKNHDPEKYISL